MCEVSREESERLESNRAGTFFVRLWILEFFLHMLLSSSLKPRIHFRIP